MFIFSWNLYSINTKSPTVYNTTSFLVGPMISVMFIVWDMKKCSCGGNPYQLVFVLYFYSKKYTAILF